MSVKLQEQEALNVVRRLHHGLWQPTPLLHVAQIFRDQQRVASCLSHQHYCSAATANAGRALNSVSPTLNVYLQIAMG